MAYDEDLADRIREAIGATGAVPDLTEKRMFGGLAFLVGGNLAVAANERGAMMVRADRDEADGLVDAGEAELVVMRDRPMRGWLDVTPEQLRTDEQVVRWVRLGVDYARSLPSK